MKEEVTINLASGGTVKVTFNVDLFAASDEDAEFVIDLIRVIQRRSCREQERMSEIIGA